MANASVQLAVDPALRGRVMGLYLLVFIGGTPFGAPAIGLLTNRFGARAGMACCGIVPILAACVMAAAIARRRRARRDCPAPPGDRPQPSPGEPSAIGSPGAPVRPGPPPGRGQVPRKIGCRRSAKASRPSR